MAGLALAADLVNLELDGAEPLERFLDDHAVTGLRAPDGDLAALRELQGRLAALWDAGSVDALAPLVNALLRSSGARPLLAKHDGWPWHLHATAPDVPVAQRVAAEAAMAVSELVRSGECGRLRRCAARGCDAVLVDLTRNRSRRFCDTGNCANREHVAAYRARRRAAGAEERRGA